MYGDWGTLILCSWTTNVLVYGNVASAPLHDIALETIRTYYRQAELWISRQVLREYLATLSRPQAFTSPKPVTTLVERVRYFESRLPRGRGWAPSHCTAASADGAAPHWRQAGA